MKTVIDLANVSLDTFKSEKIYETKTKNARLIEFVLLKGDGISPHLHPYGEDCAIVLSGRLTYYLSNNETIDCTSGDVVFGWKNVIHGYENVSDEPVHMLIFASPEETGLAYLPDDDSSVLHMPLKNRLMKKGDLSSIKSNGFGRFENIEISGMYNEQKIVNCTKVFVDSENKKIVIYEDEDVNLTTDTPVTYLRYEVES